MSKIAIVENGAVYEGYDNINAVDWCSPSFLGCSACVTASAVKGTVTIIVGLRTPFGNVSKTFNLNADVSYTWQPLSKFKITINITNFNEAGGVFSFDMGLNPCVDIPLLGWKCFVFNQHFDVPLLLTGIQNDIDDSQFASVLAFHSGNGFNDASGSSLLKGDIYNDYLNKSNVVVTMPPFCGPTVPCIPTMPQICNVTNTNIPTLPVASCIPIPTRQCVPTITSCVTGIPFICRGAATDYPTTLLPGCQHVTTLLPGCQSGETLDMQTNANDIPTLPVASCIPTRQCVPTITSCITGVPFICNSIAQGGYPTTLLPGCQHVTTLLPGCQSGGVKGLQANANDSVANAAAIPTLPVASCIPIPTRQCVPTITSCITGVPFICNSIPQGGYPTTLLPACQHVTTLLPGCQSGGAQTENAAVPTLPVSQCVNTASCYPTLSCLPTISCTGIPFVC